MILRSRRTSSRIRSSAMVVRSRSSSMQSFPSGATVIHYTPWTGDSRLPRIIEKVPFSYIFGMTWRQIEESRVRRYSKWVFFELKIGGVHTALSLRVNIDDTTHY